MVTTPVLVTYEESLLRPESSLEEVIDGELHIMPPTTFFHVLIVRQIGRTLQSGLDSSLDFVSEAGFLIAERPRLRYRIPDIAIVDVARLKQLAQARAVYARFPPLAVIEVLSPANRKGNVAQLLRDYRDMGVEQIVFIDPEAETIAINGTPLIADQFTIANVTFQVSDFFD